ncbi:MAG: DUF362 domain-containing protein [Candidatus Helarchaeota archaeon]
MNRVCLEEQFEYDVEQIREKCLRVLKNCGMGPKLRDKTILLKPSLVYPYKSEELLGINTQPAFIAGACKALREFEPKKILVGENTSLSSQKIKVPSLLAFKITGTLDAIEGLAEPVYFSEAEHVEVTVPEPLVQTEPFEVPRIWLDADVFISLPKIKTNLFTKVTLSIKNNLGFLPIMNRIKHHTTAMELHQKIADLYRVRPPDFVLVDAIHAGEGQGPMIAEPFNLGLIIGGSNGPAVDAVCCRLMGFEPGEIEHLRFVSEAGLGSIDLDEIEIVNEDLLKRGKRFARADPTLTNLSPRFLFILGPDGVCESGCAGMIRCVLDNWILEYGAESLPTRTFILGKGIRPEELPPTLERKTTAIIGDCCKHLKDLKIGKFLGGCPVVPLDAEQFMSKFLKCTPKFLEERLKEVLKMLQK